MPGRAQIRWEDLAPTLVRKLGSGSYGQVYEVRAAARRTAGRQRALFRAARVQGSLQRASACALAVHATNVRTLHGKNDAFV